MDTAEASVMGEASFLQQIGETLELAEVWDLASQYSPLLEEARMELGQAENSRNQALYQQALVPGPSVDEAIYNPVGYREKLFDSYRQREEIYFRWQQAQSAYDQRVRSVRESIYVGYFNLLKAERNLKAARRVVERAATHLAAAEKRQQLGRIAAKEVSVLRLEARKARLAVNSAERQRQLARLLLTRRTGLERWPDVALASLEDTPDFNEDPENLARVLTYRSQVVWDKQEKIEFLDGLHDEAVRRGWQDTPGYSRLSAEIKLARQGLVVALAKAEIESWSRVYELEDMAEQIELLGEDLAVVREEVRRAKVKYRLGRLSAAELATAEDNLARAGDALAGGREDYSLKLWRLRNWE